MHVAPTAVATIIRLSISTVSTTLTFHRLGKRLRVEDAPTQEDIDDALLAKKLDGTPVKQDAYDDRIRLTRLTLIILAALGLASNVAEIAYSTARMDGPFHLADMSRHSGHIFSAALVWALIIQLSVGGLPGPHLWSSVVTMACLDASLLFADVALLATPKSGISYTPLIFSHVFLSLLAMIVIITTPSGPRRLKARPDGTFRMARVGGKGKTIISFLWFTTAFPLIRAAQRKGQLDESDTALLGSDMSAQLLYKRFAKLYEKNKVKAKTSRVPTATLRSCWPLLCTIVAANKALFITNQVLGAFTGILFYAPSYATFRIVSVLENSEKSGEVLSHSERLQRGLPFCLLLGAALLLPVVSMSHLMTISTQWLRNRIRIQLTTAILAKGMRRKDAAGDKKVDESIEEVDKVSKDDSEQQSFASKTQIVNLASVDTERVSNVVYLISFCMAPVEILTGGFFSIKLLGWGAVIGLGACVALQPIIFLLGKLVAKFQRSQQITRDRKVTLLNEILQAIRMIKFSAWERQTADRMKVVRDEELRYQRILFWIQIALGMLTDLSPILVILIAYGWFTLVEQRLLTPSVAFTAMAVLLEMRYSLTHIPEGISELIQSLVSVARIQEYLDGPEVEIPKLSQGTDARLTDASVQWPKLTSSDFDTSVFQLQHISVHFTPNALNLIVGRIGAGKTLLLRALLGEAEVVQGSVTCPRSLPSSIKEDMPEEEQNWLRKDQTSYVPQSAFLISGSIRSNILFGLPMIESRYLATLGACGLIPDLKLLEDGDETEIGEDGIGLSGGQKIRVSLARAAYGRAAMVLLDDCLSAVDAHTADHIHKNLLQGPLFQNRTIIMVTHQVQLVAQSADKVVLLEEGQIRFQGDPIAFMESNLYHGLIEEVEPAAPPPDLPSMDTTPSTTAPPSPQLDSANQLPTVDKNVGEAPSETLLKPTPRKLLTTEVRAKGAVLLSIYGRYIKAAGGTTFAILLFILFVSSNSFIVVTSRWLQAWSSDTISAHQKHSDEWWLSRWAILFAVQLLVETLRLLALFYGSLRASRKLYAAMLDSILAAPLRFHDTISRGRLLNRFGYDFEEVDSELAEIFARFGDEAINFILSMIVITSGGGIAYLIVFVLMVPIYVLVGRLYMTAARDMKRLTSTTRSPVLSVFSDVVSGVSVMRSFGACDHFFRVLVDRIETNVTFAYCANDLRWWYEGIFNTLNSVLLMFASVAVLLNTSVGAARAGFIFSFLITSHYRILFMLQAYTITEQKLVSVERIVEYTTLEGEEKKISQQERRPVPSAWPYAGAVEIENLRVRYAKDLPEVLRGISVSIPAGAKVGVVGPTGCGKSTLASSFFRFVEASAGKIAIDGIDIATVPLQDLRSRLQIVPQDPIILSGPLRASVDVQNDYSDAEVRRALKDVQLLKEAEDGAATPSRSDVRDLHYHIKEGGSNLSNGEKQLLCLARAILRRAKLIIFDEATSSVDFDTDQAISQAIRQTFRGSTIVTIAHRLRSIIDYDYVLVMDAGQAVEFDSPVTLLQDPGTRFSKLCRASGRREAAHLRAMAEAAAASATAK